MNQVNLPKNQEGITWIKDVDKGTLLIDKKPYFNPGRSPIISLERTPKKDILERKSTLDELINTNVGKILYPTVGNVRRIPSELVNAASIVDMGKAIITGDTELANQAVKTRYPIIQSIQNALSCNSETHKV